MADQHTDAAHSNTTGGPAWLRRTLDQMVTDGAPAVLAEFRDERGACALAAGTAELDARRPVDPGGWFRIGSVTKTFTATVILQLVGEGRLGLQDPVERWLPGQVPGGEHITVRQLLDHTSGLHNYTADLTIDSILRDRSRHWPLHEIVALATRHPPQFDPGSSRAYNNTGYVVLGLLIEAVSGRPYGEQIHQRILDPLGLHHTRVCDDTSLLPPPHAHGYLAVDGEPVDVTTYNPSQAGPAGGMISTAADLNRFFAALLAGRLLDPAQLHEMTTTVPTNTPGVDAGLGLARYDLPNGAVAWGKDGGFHGYRTWSFHTRDASRQLTVSATTALTTPPTTPHFLATVATAFTTPTPANP